MKRLLIVAALAAASMPAAAQTPTPSPTQTPQPSRSTPFAVTETEIVGEVVKVNKSAKTIVVKDPAGKKLKLSVPADVTTLNDVKPGHMLDIRYINAVALQVAKPGAGTTFTAEENVRLAPQGGSPAEITAKTKRMSATVTDFDQSRREITVKAPEGHSMALMLPETFTDWDSVKVGDTLAIQYTEAMALTASKREGEGARDFERSSTPMPSTDRTDTDTRRPGSDPMYQQRNEPTQQPSGNTPNQQPSNTPNQPR